MTIGSNEYSYTAAPGAGMVTVLNSLIKSINKGEGSVTASRSGTKLIVSADQAGEAFTIAAATTNSTPVETKTPTVSVAGSTASVEITSVDFGDAAYDAGDTIKLTINGTEYSVTLDAATSSADLAAAFVAQIESTEFDLAANDSGQLVITGTATNDALGVTVAVDNIATTKAEAPTVAVTKDNVAGDVAQVSTVTLTGEFNLGETVNVKIGTTEFSYLVQVGDTLAEVLAGVQAAINANDEIGVTASSTVEGELTLTATATGTPFDVVTSVTAVTPAPSNATVTDEVTTANSGATEAAQQIDTITLAGAFDAGDKVQVTIGDATFDVVTTKGQTLTSIAEALAAAINAEDSAVKAVVVATNVEGVLTLTAKEAGTGFTASSKVEQVTATNGCGRS